MRSVLGLTKSIFILAGSPAETASGSRAKSMSSVPLSVATTCAFACAYAGTATSGTARSAAKSSAIFTVTTRRRPY